MLRTRYLAEYYYPGLLFPESTFREISDATLEEVAKAAPDEDGYFSKDNWYAVRVKAIDEERFVNDFGEVRWVEVDRHDVASWIVGDLIHIDDIPDTARNSILRSNIRINTKSGYAIKTRVGNWQFPHDWEFVISPDNPTLRV